jgi:signal transduction histidine kinase
MFKGLAKQNMLFHQCVCELVDNAIAATPPEKKFRVEVMFRQSTFPDTWDCSAPLKLDQ